MTRSVFSPAYQRLRESLVAARLSRHLTQAQLALALGLPQSFVSKYERGERRVDVVELVEIAIALRVDPCALVDEIRAALESGGAAL